MDELHVICAKCGAPCYWEKLDRVTFGDNRAVFTERRLCCSGCGVASSLVACFPWETTLKHRSHASEETMFPGTGDEQ